MKVRARLRHRLRALQRARGVWLGLGGAAIWALADLSAAATPAVEPVVPAAVEAARAALQSRVEAVRARLQPTSPPTAGDSQASFLAQATNWTNWPKWSKWANWANR